MKLWHIAIPVADRDDARRLLALLHDLRVPMNPVFGDPRFELDQAGRLMAAGHRHLAGAGTVARRWLCIRRGTRPCGCEGSAHVRFAHEPLCRRTRTAACREGEALTMHRTFNEISTKRELLALQFPDQATVEFCREPTREGRDVPRYASRPDPKRRGRGSTSRPISTGSMGHGDISPCISSNSCSSHFTTGPTPHSSSPRRFRRPTCKRRSSASSSSSSPASIPTAACSACRAASRPPTIRTCTGGRTGATTGIRNASAWTSTAISTGSGTSGPRSTRTRSPKTRPTTTTARATSTSPMTSATASAAITATSRSPSPSRAMSRASSMRTRTSGSSSISTASWER